MNTAADTPFLIILIGRNMLIQLTKITKNYDGLPIFDGLDFAVNEGDKMGLIGNNGTGKTSLFKIMIGQISPELGSINKKKKLKIGYVQQELSIGEQSPFQYILESFEEIGYLKKQLQELEEQLSNESSPSDEMLNHYGNVQEKFESLGGVSIEDRIVNILKSFGLEEQMYLPMSFISGGERVRVELARILLSDAELLLLDEPTNHLDMTGIIWLENYLKTTHKAFIVISHDREFLNNTVKKVVQLEDGKANSYKGNYSEYVKQKKEEIERLKKSYELQQREILRLKKLIRQFRQWANEGDNQDFYKKAKEIEHRLERMILIKEPPRNENRLRVEVKSTEKAGKEQIVVEGLVKTIGNRILFENANFTVLRNDRIAILGDNGSGKTCLLKILMGQIKADSGTFKIASSAKIGYVPQIITFSDVNLRLIDVAKTLIGNEQEARRELAKFAFYASDVTKRIKDLSGGEKVRLYLMTIFQKKINLLILDEPTNHLDILAREEIEQVLSKYQGTLIAVSHDRYFLKKIFNQSLIFQNGTIDRYDSLPIDLV